ncbi:MAG: beta-CASP ribonuclease aCPSF1 [Candidatus Micrarchaeota archaeon]|nr:beta-CASP ribonuclease aCPSF1 [Candidatus Micrarchaeota archaeon]
MEETTEQIIEKIKAGVPEEAKISDIKFEGCEIVLYSKNPKIFEMDLSFVKELVSRLKKRIIVRPDPSICKDPENAKKIIEESAPEEAGIKQINFEPEFSLIVIEAEKPGVLIGKGGETLRDLKKKVLWDIRIKRVPAIPSDIVKTLREMIHRESAFRKEFLDRVGRRIHSGWKGTEWIRFTALGGFREVGRSCILLQTPESKVLLDCGIKPGNDEFPYLSVPELNIQNLNAVVLSHPHLDHCGMIPYLYEYGYDGPLYCTAPARDLMVLLCMDYIELAQREGKNAPYTTKGIKNAVRHSICIEYEEVSDITPDMRLTFFNAGHILGSALVHIHVGEGLYNILYTSDFKFEKTALFEPASLGFPRAETVIIESTYGSSQDVQPRRKEAEQNLMNIINKTVERGGKVLIPSFAVGRAQDVMVILAENGFEYPVYLEGMLWDALAIHTAYPEYLSREIQKMIFHQGFNPFTAEIFKRVGSADERKDVIESKDPCVIIATSGMMTGGPVLEYLRGLAENEKNTLVFVGYQAEGTFGRRIQKGWREVPMQVNGKTIALPINCEVATVEGLSGHSDYRQLINYVSRMRQKPERIVCNHGDNNKCVELARSLHRLFRCETLAPKVLETVRLK